MTAGGGDDRDRHARLAELFRQARRVPAGERQAWLERHGAGDPALLAHLRRLLAEGDPAATSLFGAAVTGATVPGGPGAGDAPTRRAGDAPERIDRYRIVHRIGSGGFGDVYLARQHEPVQRLVALKLIRPEVATPRIIKRFHDERQVLALMDHPNLARMFDAGVTSSGQPYFVMEHIDGVPITRFCDDRQLDLRQRVRLMIDVCLAVHHAHQRGIIHRDLKPSNLLVADLEGIAVPKVIDFGIAKAVGEPAGASMTQEGQILGTPAYMSPEQASGSRLAVDVRSDVYALGVVLYELLSGGLPIEPPDDEPLIDVLRRVREEEPGRLTTRLERLDPETVRSLAERRGLSRSALQRAVRGEPSWIAMRALAKDPDRRYPSALDLARDLERYLDGAPVEAGPPSATYRLAKFVRRHRALVAGAAAVTLTVLIGAVTTTLGWRNALDAQRETAEAQDARDRRAYVDGIALAGRTLISGSDVVLVKRYLESTPERLRGWEWHHLRRECDTRLRVLRPAAPIASMAGSPDGTLLAVGDPTGAIAVLDVATWGEVARHVVEGAGAVTRLRFTESGRENGGGYGDKKIRVWAARDRGEPRTTIDTTFRTPIVGMDVRGGRVIASCQGPWIRVWEVQTGAQLVEHDYVRNSSMGGLALLPDGRAFWGMSAVSFRTPELAADGDEIPAEGQMWRSAVSPDGDRIAFGTTAGRVQVVRTETKEITSTNIAHWQERVQAIAWSPDGETLASADGGGLIRIGGRTLRGHDARVIDLAFVDGGAVLASGSRDGTVGLWAVDPPAPTRLALRNTSAFAFSADGRRIVSSESMRGARIHDLLSGEVLARLVGHAAHVNSVACDDSGRIIATGSVDETVRLWDAVTGAALAVIEHGAEIADIAFRPGTLHLATLAADGLVRIRDETGAALWTGRVEAGRSSLGGIAFDEDGRRLVAGFDAVHVWELDSTLDRSAHLGPFEVPGMVRDIAIDGGADRIAVATGRGDLAILDARSGARLLERRVRAGVNAIWALDLSPDRTRLATSINDTTMIWEWPSCTELLTLCEGRGIGPESVAFSPDGTRLVSTGFLKIWDTLPASERAAERRAMSEATPAARSAIRGRIESAADVGVVAAELARELPIEGTERQVALDALLLAADAWRREGLGSWSTTVQAPFASVPVDTRPWGNVEFDDDGHYLGFRLNGEAIRIVELPSGRELVRADPEIEPDWWRRARVELPTQVPQRVLRRASSPDGRLIAAYTEHDLYIWQGADDASPDVHHFEHRAPGRSLAIDRAGTMVAFGTVGDIRLWSIAAGLNQAPARMDPKTSAADGAIDVEFSADGTLLVAGHPDGAVTVWRVPSGERVAVLDGEGWPRVAMHADGTILAAMTGRGTLRLWDATPFYRPASEWDSILARRRRALRGETGPDLSHEAACVALHHALKELPATTPPPATSP